MNHFLDHALKYAAMGWHIHPLVPRQKVPITKHGVKDATTDEKQIRAWWKKWSDANIAVACGKKSGIYVVDVDINKEKGISGIESLREFPPLPETIKQITPGGGFHVFYRAINAPVNRNTFRPGIDIRGGGYYVVITPSIHPNGSCYNWSDSLAPWQIEPAEFPDFMRPSVKAPWSNTKLIVYPTRLPDNDTQQGNDTQQRASLYLAECDPAVQGGGGHSRLLWAAVALVHGFLLSENQAIDLLICDYNPRCEPPWNLSNPKDLKDFRRKVKEARKLIPKEQPGWLLNDPAYAPVDVTNVDVDALIKSAENPQTVDGFREVVKKPLDKTHGIGYWFGGGREEKANEQTNKKTESSVDRGHGDDSINSELNFLAHPTGLLGRLCSWINKTAMKEQPLLTLACTLTFCGALFGRKVRDELGSRTNLYCMGVAKSSAGKFHALKQVRRLCTAVGCLNLLGGDDWSSDSAIEKKLSEQPTTFFLCDEIGHLLSSIKTSGGYHQVKIIPLLMKLWSAAGSVYTGKEYAEDDKQRTLIQPCCCIYGCSDPYRFAKGITEEELHDGWLSRCLVFLTDYDPPKKYIPETPVPLDIVDSVREWALREEDYSIKKDDISPFVQGSTIGMTPVPPKQFVIPTDSFAKQIFINFDKEAVLIGRRTPRFDCLWRKAEEIARRIAVIVAASESFNNPKITQAIADYSCRLMRFLLNDFSQKMAITITNSQVDLLKYQLLTIITKAGIKGCLARDLTRGTRDAIKRQRSDSISDLIEAEEIARKKDGRTLRYWTIENFIKHEKHIKRKQ